MYLFGSWQQKNSPFSQVHWWEPSHKTLVGPEALSPQWGETGFLALFYSSEICRNPLSLDSSPLPRTNLLLGNPTAFCTFNNMASRFEQTPSTTKQCQTFLFTLLFWFFVWLLSIYSVTLVWLYMCIYLFFFSFLLFFLLFFLLHFKGFGLLFHSLKEQLCCL